MPCNFLCRQLAFNACLICLVRWIAGDQIQLSRRSIFPQILQIGTDRVQDRLYGCAFGNAQTHLPDRLWLNVHAIDLLRGSLPLHQHGDNAAAGAEVADAVFLPITGKFRQQHRICAEPVQ